jgi:hypothetical protein
LAARFVDCKWEIGMNVRELIKKQRELVASGNPMKRLAGALLIPAVLAERLAGLADRQIGQLLLDEVWPCLSPLHPESVLCLHAADRLRGSPNVKCPDCPRCGSEMIRHVGIDEPDFLECSHLRCGHRKPAQH